LRGHTHYVRSLVISPDGKRIISGSSDKTIRMWDLESQLSAGAPTILFSSRQHHALCSATSFLQNPHATVSRTGDGWIVDPEGRLLLWVPSNFHPSMYFPGNTLVIPNDSLQLDLSCFAHGTLWDKCREQARPRDLCLGYNR